jgi:hypothetical protein
VLSFINWLKLFELKSNEFLLNRGRISSRSKLLKSVCVVL